MAHKVIYIYHLLRYDFFPFQFSLISSLLPLRKVVKLRMVVGAGAQLTCLVLESVGSSNLLSKNA